MQGVYRGPMGPRPSPPLGKCIINFFVKNFQTFHNSRFVVNFNILWDLCTQIYDFDVTNENKHAKKEVNEQTSHGCKFAVLVPIYRSWYKNLAYNPELRRNN